jgi:nitrogen fixation NifU-like protein
MSDLRDLYQDVILDHSRSPRNFGALADANRNADGYNPLCGDKISLHLHVEGDRITGVSFQGTGCAISTASASVLTDVVMGKTVAEAHELFRRFRSMVTAPIDAEIDEDALGKLAVFSGIREFPVRVKCATLAWHTLEAALESATNPVTTE